MNNLDRYHKIAEHLDFGKDVHAVAALEWYHAEVERLRRVDELARALVERYDAALYHEVGEETRRLLDALASEVEQRPEQHPEPQCKALMPAPPGFRGIVLCRLAPGHDNDHQSVNYMWGQR